MQLSALIVDDEPMARQRVHDLLRERSEVRVVGECRDGEEAVKAIRAQSPDIVFLDIQMPRMDGFDALAQLDEDEVPEVVFITAHDQFALQAFEVHAVDYLLKPYDRDRFHSAVDAACARARAGREAVRKMSGLLTQIRDRSEGVDRIPIKTDGRIIFVATDTIDWIEAANNYAAIHVGAKTHLVRETMTKLEARLPSERFIRISRSAIVNAASIRELKPRFHGDYTVVLNTGSRLRLSRTYRDRLARLTSQLMG